MVHNTNGDKMKKIFMFLIFFININVFALENNFCFSKANIDVNDYYDSSMFVLYDQLGNEVDSFSSDDTHCTADINKGIYKLRVIPYINNTYNYDYFYEYIIDFTGNVHDFNNIYTKKISTPKNLSSNKIYVYGGAFSFFSIGLLMIYNLYKKM